MKGKLQKRKMSWGAEIAWSHDQTDYWTILYITGPNTLCLVTPLPRQTGRQANISLRPESWSVAGWAIFSWVDWGKVKRSILLKNTTYHSIQELNPLSNKHKCNALTTRPHSFTKAEIKIIILNDRDDKKDCKKKRNLPQTFHLSIHHDHAVATELSPDLDRHWPNRW